MRNSKRFTAIAVSLFTLSLASPAAAQLNLSRFSKLTLGASARPVVHAPRPKPSNDCSWEGKRRYSVGNKKYASGALVGQANIYAPKNSRQSDITGRIQACFLGKCRDLGRAAVEGKSKGGSRIYVKLAGATVYNKKVSSVGKRKKNFSPKSLKIGVTAPVIPGIVSGFAQAKFGVGAKMNANWNIKATPPLANIGGSAEAYANASGEAGVKLLGGVAAKGSLEAKIKLPAPKVEGKLQTNVCRHRSTDADVKFSSYNFDLKAKFRAGCLWGKCIYKKDKTVYKKSGGTKSYDIL